MLRNTKLALRARTQVPLIFKTFYDRIQNVIETSTFPKNVLMRWALRAGKRRRKVFDEGREGFSPFVAVEWYVNRVVTSKKSL